MFVQVFFITVTAALVLGMSTLSIIATSMVLGILILSITITALVVVTLVIFCYVPKLRDILDNKHELKL